VFGAANLRLYHRQLSFERRRTCLMALFIDKSAKLRTASVLM
jgi:hypothetical protein